jgi:hypothetical protein
MVKSGGLSNSSRSTALRISIRGIETSSGKKGGILLPRGGKIDWCEREMQGKKSKQAEKVDEGCYPQQGGTFRPFPWTDPR